MTDERLLTVAEIAAALRMTRPGVAAWLRQGRLPGFKIGRHWRVRETEFQAWLRAQAAASARARLDPACACPDERARLLAVAEADRAAAEAALAALRQSQAQLVQADKLAAVGTLAAGVAHELNQPLTVIRAQAQFLRDQLVADAALALKLARIERQTEKMARVIDHLRAFSRAGQGEAARPVDLNGVAREALLLVGQQLRERGIALRLDLAAPGPMALADANEVEQVVLNLLVNARDALGRGGEVVVRTRRDAANCRLTVADSGPGIPDAVLPRLFQPFFTTKPVGQGTGLGLSISREIARNWGGDLALANRPAGGAVATLTLPADAAAFVALAAD